MFTRAIFLQSSCHLLSDSYIVVLAMFLRQWCAFIYLFIDILLIICEIFHHFLQL